MEERNKNIFEYGVVALFVFLFLFLKLGQPWNYSLVHNYPAFYNANDNFMNGYVVPQYIKESGSYMYAPPHTIGGYKNIIGYYPPIFLQISSALSSVTGFQVYDTSYILAIFFSITTALIVYLAIRKYSRDLAILSLPFMLGVFNFDFEIARVFGLWLYLTGTLFFASMIWIIGRISEKRAPIFFAILFSGAILGHPPEAIFSAGFVVFYLFALYLKNHKIPIDALRTIGMGFAGSFIISFYYLIIFKYALMAGVAHQYKLFSVMAAPDFAPGFGVKLGDFGMVFPLLIAGILFAIKKISFRKIDEMPFTAILAGLFVLIAGYSNYLGTGVRAWQTRTSWPFTLAIFSGIVLYYVVNRFIKNYNMLHISAISTALLLLFATIHAGQLNGGGIVEEKAWNALMWIKNNTPENSKVYYYYMPMVAQPSALWATGRSPYIIDTVDYIDAANKGIVKDNYKAYIFGGDWVNSNFAYRTSLFDYHYLADNVSVIEGFSNKSSIDADYHTLQIGGASNNPAVSQYNSAIRDKLLKSNKNVTEVFSNGVISILKQTEH